MSSAAHTALVLQGGGALGAYELGAARRLYEEPGFAPDLVCGVSIGAVTAVLLARPKPPLTPLGALERFWEAVVVGGWPMPPMWGAMAAMFGNPHFFVPRTDLIDMASWTSLYDTRPLLQTLSELVDVAALEDPAAEPRLLFSAADVEAGEVAYFDSAEAGLTLTHVLASASLPPAFPMTLVEGRGYWDGGLFDNTPLGAVLDRLSRDAATTRRVVVVSLFPNQAPLPRTLTEVSERAVSLLFANRTCEDLKLMARFDEVARLMRALETLEGGNPLAGDPAFEAVAARDYVAAPAVISITRPEMVEGFDGIDFTPATIEARAAEGYRQTDKILAEQG